VLEGFAAARADRILFADADGATSARSLMRLIRALDEHDVAIGSRKLASSLVTQTQPAVRRLLSRSFGLAAWTVFGMPFTDTQCGAKAFRRDAARTLAGVVREHSWTFDLELLLCALRLQLDVIEVPVEWGDRAGSTVRVGSTLTSVLGSFRRIHDRRLRTRGARTAPLAQVLRPSWQEISRPETIAAPASTSTPAAGVAAARSLAAGA
jgi:hypothetical protein